MSEMVTQEVLNEDVDPEFGVIPDENLYVLPQPDLEEVRVYFETEKSTEVSENPVLKTVEKKVPIKDSNGNIIKYEEEKIVYEEEEFTWEDENGETITEIILVGKVVKTGNLITCTNTIYVDQHEEDEEGNLLYWHEIRKEEIVFIPQESLLITRYDDRWTPELEVYVEPTPPVEPPRPHPPLDNTVAVMKVELSELATLNHEQDFVIEDNRENVEWLEMDSASIIIQNVGNEVRVNVIEEDSADMFFDLMVKDMDIDILEEENADLFFDSMEKEMQIESIEEENADLLFETVNQGIMMGVLEERIAELETVVNDILTTIKQPL